MENFLRKYGWTLRLAAIAAVCLLIAMSVNGFIAGALAPYTVPPTPNLFAQVKSEQAKNTSKNPTSTKNKNWTRSISERCFFGCVEKADEPSCPAEGCPEGQQCVSGQCVPAQEGTSELVASDGKIPVPSDLNLKLTGVMVSKTPEWSTALISDPGTSTGYVARIDDQIASQAKLVEIKRDRIIIERNGRLEYIRLESAITGNPGGPGVAGPPQARAVTPPATTRQVNEPTKPAQAAKKAVQRTDENAYQIDRKSMNAQLENKAALAKGATVVPNYKNGKKSGLKLVNVSADSVYQQLGMQSGDVLQSVNGEKIRSQAHAMEMMERFQKADNVTIEVERGGKRTKIKYDIK